MRLYRHSTGAYWRNRCRLYPAIAGVLSRAAFPRAPGRLTRTCSRCSSWGGGAA